MGEKPCDQLLVKEEGDLPPCLRCSKVEMSLLMTLFLVRGSKEMIVWTLAYLVDWAWSWLFALGWLRLFAPMQLLVVAVPSLVEIAIFEAWMFLLKAIEVGSKMMKISFFEGEGDERQRGPTGRARICQTSKIISQMWIYIDKCVVQFSVIIKELSSDSISLKDLLIGFVVMWFWFEHPIYFNLAEEWIKDLWNRITMNL